MYHVADAADAPSLLKSVRESYVSYLRAEIISRFQPLSEREYLSGPVGILNTFARFSYVLDEEKSLLVHRMDARPSRDRSDTGCHAVGGKTFSQPRVRWPTSIQSRDSKF